jgi:hypothetical protein
MFNDRDILSKKFFLFSDFFSHFDFGDAYRVVRGSK